MSAYLLVGFVLFFAGAENDAINRGDAFLGTLIVGGAVLLIAWLAGTKIDGRS